MKTYNIDLPAEFRSGNSIPVERATFTRERMQEVLEAYADARVREALEEAARRIELLRDSHCADTALGGAKDACTPDGSNCDIVSAWNDSIEIVRALIPPTE